MPISCRWALPCVLVVALGGVARAETGRLTLADLERLALANNPSVRQAAADVEAAKAAALQAGLLPKQSSSLDDATIEKVLTRRDKGELTKVVRLLEVRNAEEDLRKAKSDVRTRVRAAYFALLAAREQSRVSRAVIRVTKAASAARPGPKAADPKGRDNVLYLRVLSYQARVSGVTARNSYCQAKKQLAAAVGVPGLLPGLVKVVGRIDRPVPVFEYEKVKQRVLRSHSDVRKARYAVEIARLNLCLAQVKGPDVQSRRPLPGDLFGAPFELMHDILLSMPVPVPVRNRDQGGIMQAQTNLVNSSEEPHRVRVTLDATLADAFNRYQTNRELLAMYRDKILPDQIRACRRSRERGETDPIEQLVARGNLAKSVYTYLSVLASTWSAAVDVADLLQTEDLFGGQTQPVAPVPDVEKLLR